MLVSMCSDCPGEECVISVVTDCPGEQWVICWNLLEIVTSESHKRLDPICSEGTDLSAAHGTLLKTDLKTYPTPE